MIFELLSEALERAGRDKHRGLELGRSFAKHAYAQVQDTMAGAFAASSEAHWRATGAYIDGECSREQLLEAVAAIRKIETRGERWGMVETPTLVSGVLALCLRFEETSVQRWHKTLRDLANDAQSVVAEKASQRALDDPKKAYAAARWEEARWQLQYIIATEPNLAAG